MIMTGSEQLVVHYIMRLERTSKIFKFKTLLWLLSSTTAIGYYSKRRWHSDQKISEGHSKIDKRTIHKGPTLRVSISVFKVPINILTFPFFRTLTVTSFPFSFLTLHLFLEKFRFKSGFICKKSDNVEL